LKRRKFARLCLILSAIGLVMLHVSTSYLKPETIKIEEVDEGKVGKVVKIQGNITDFYSTGSASFFTVKDSKGEIQVVSFNSRDIGSSQQVEVLGKVELREGEVQLVSTKIEQN
jgi:RecJ-like exonuclease